MATSIITIVDLAVIWDRANGFCIELQDVIITNRVQSHLFSVLIISYLYQLGFNNSNLPYCLEYLPSRGQKCSLNIFNVRASTSCLVGFLSPLLVVMSSETGATLACVVIAVLLLGSIESRLGEAILLREWRLSRICYDSATNSKSFTRINWFLKSSILLFVSWYWSLLAFNRIMRLMRTSFHSIWLTETPKSSQRKLNRDCYLICYNT